MLSRFTTLALVSSALCVGCSTESDSLPDAEASAGASAETPAAALDATAVLDEVAAAMGVGDVTSLTYSGTAWRIRNSFMQTPNASPPWPYRDEITDYRRTIDLEQPESLATGDTFASNIFLDPPVAGTYVQHVAADEQGWSQQLEIWLTPWGFLSGAERYDAEADVRGVDGSEYTVLTWQSPPDQTAPSGLRYTVNGYVNDENLVERVETWVEHPFMGDFHVEGRYADYRDIDGLMVPATIEQWRGGGAVFGVNVEAASANPENLAALLTPPETTRPAFAGGPPGAPEAAVEQVDDRVWLVTGGYVALVAEFEDHLLVFEAGQSEAWGERVIEEVRGIRPDKPIRYVVNSHPHSDHTAGLVPFVREGATIVTHENNVEFLRMALGTPRTLLGEEALNPSFEGVGSLGVYEDETMRVELHHVPNRHSDGMLVAFLPEQEILFQADFTLPREGAEANPFVVTLAEYVDEQGLEFERYLAVHAAQVPQTKADLMAAIGK